MKHEFDHEFFSEISKYDVSMLLQVFANLNSKVYKNKYLDESIFYQINLADYNSGNMGVLNIFHWTVRDIIFQIYRRSHEDCTNLKSSILERDMYRMIGLYNDYENELSKIALKRKPILFFLYGLGEQQFRGQIDAFKADKKRNDIIFNKLDVHNYFDINLAIKKCWE